MQRLTAKEIKKVLLGIVISDGSIQPSQWRFDLYTKQEEYAKYVYEVLRQITGMGVQFKVKRDKRGYIGYRVWTRKHAYWKTMYNLLYRSRKQLTFNNVSKIDAQALAHIWMCDGYLEHSKNRAKGKIQNIGWLCLESFDHQELLILIDHLWNTFGIKCSLIKKPWGFGYRVRVGGENLQKLVSLVYPHILDCFKYKTPLFYKSKESANMSLPSAEHFIQEYNEVDDIVRHSEKSEKTDG